MICPLGTAWILIGMGEWIWVWIEVSVKGRKVLLVLGEEISYLWGREYTGNVPWLLGRTETYMIYFVCLSVCVGVLLGQILIKKVKNSMNK